jgi:hypothetical protein
VGPWWATLGGVALRLPSGGPISTSVMLEAGVPIVHQKYEITDVGVVHEPAPVIGRASIGTSFAFF